MFYEKKKKIKRNQIVEIINTFWQFKRKLPVSKRTELHISRLPDDVGESFVVDDVVDIGGLLHLYLGVVLGVQTLHRQLHEVAPHVIELGIVDLHVKYQVLLFYSHGWRSNVVMLMI